VPGHPLLDSAHRPHPRAPPRPAQARHDAGGRARPGHSAAHALLPGAFHSGRKSHAARASDASSRADAVRGTATTGSCGTSSTRPISTTARSQTASPGFERSCSLPECAWISRDVEQKALGHAVANVVPEHWQRFAAASCAHRQDRARGEGPAHQERSPIGTTGPSSSKLQEQAASPTPASTRTRLEAGRLASGPPREAASGLENWERRFRRWAARGCWAELLVVPMAYCAAMTGGKVVATHRTPVADTQPGAPAARARAVILEIENEASASTRPSVKFERLGYTTSESRVPGHGARLRFIEVKRVASAGCRHPPSR
jgi:hypothetical protein